MRRATKVSLGLFAVWAISDLEEVATMSRQSRDILGSLPAVLPVSGRLRREGISQRHFLTAFGLMGVVMGMAAALGARSGGRSALFRGALLAFGLHGFGHMASAAALRRYTPGLATAPAMVIPFWLWARRELAKNGVRAVDRPALGIAAAGLPVTLAVHFLSDRLTRPNREKATRREPGHG